jgi:hypothetical protein
VPNIGGRQGGDFAILETRGNPPPISGICTEGIRADDPTTFESGVPMKALVYIAMAIVGCASAASHPTPVNVLHKTANWQSDLKACQRVVDTDFVPAAVTEANATTAVCEVNENSVTCRDMRVSGNAARSRDQARKPVTADDQDRQQMLSACLSDKGWRQQ